MDSDIPALEPIDSPLTPVTAPTTRRSGRNAFSIPLQAQIDDDQSSTNTDLTSNGDGDDDNEENWDDWVEDNDDVLIAMCLFCIHRAQTWPKSEADIWMHMEKAHGGFSLQRTVKELDLDFHGTVRLINYIRFNVARSISFRLVPSPKLRTTLLADDSLLKPVLENDALIMTALEEVDDNDEVADSSRDPKKSPSSALLTRTSPPLESSAIASSSDANLATLLTRLDVAERRAEILEASHTEYREMVRRTFLEEEGEEVHKKVTKNVRKGDANAETKGKKSDGSSSEGEFGEERESYFDSYATVDIHETMLKDKVRTDAYRDFVYLNKNLFSGKIVLDVGCGTGILSMFCARAGASKVYAVDNSDIVDRAREIVKMNGLDGVVTVLRGKIETTLLPTKVDIIVSEWMGYFLLFEAMLDSVIAARDTHLTQGGIMAPAGAEMYAGLWSDAEWMNERIGFWENVYGFRMETFKEDYYKEGQIEILEKNSIISELVKLKSWDLSTCDTSSLDFTSTVVLRSFRRNLKVYGIVISFDVTFTAPLSPDVHDVRMTTSPLDTPTHWKQGLLLLRDPIVIGSDGPDEVTLQLSFCKGAMNKRELEVAAQISVGDGATVAQRWYVR
ncbi:hypothetical protein HDU93_004663 [Gonapodya sp. JEL0774]|nr:hypothetical protein HDU93_004663 [Gonapodya sp. JEL0774]